MPKINYKNYKQDSIKSFATSSGSFVDDQTGKQGTYCKTPIQYNQGSENNPIEPCCRYLVMHKQMLVSIKTLQCIFFLHLTYLRWEGGCN